jgi:hypothetical protein
MKESSSLKLFGLPVRQGILAQAPFVSVKRTTDLDLTSNSTVKRLVGIRRYGHVDADLRTRERQKRFGICQHIRFDIDAL